MSDEAIAKKLMEIAKASSPDKADDDSIAMMRMFLADSDPRRGTTMLLAFASGVAKGAGFTIEEIDAAVRAGFEGKPGAFGELKIESDA